MFIKVSELTCKVCHKPIIVGQMAVEVKLMNGSIIVPVHSRTGVNRGKTCLDELRTHIEISI